jgi:hypothetical protein
VGRGGGGISTLWGRDIFRRIDFVTVFYIFLFFRGEKQHTLALPARRNLPSCKGGEPGKWGDSSGTQGKFLKIRSLRYSRKTQKEIREDIEKLLEILNNEFGENLNRRRKSNRDNGKRTKLEKNVYGN